ncbi:uncharacterized protein LOC112056400 [Bicyclus anynana]|uniref:Uncharacterized protein LOC112056400 n=1 Tax=Bicyclus anynana TaxID=110368 RepID=A0ABM3LV61_BICAN|nr:uncharacterized protein LOC112056400 [Bicyclus anynana]
MRLLTCFTTFALVGLLTAAPSLSDDDKLVITKEFYVQDFIKYKSDHDIVKLLVPLNSLNFDEDDSRSSESNEVDTDIIIFFVEADVQPDGSYIDKGLYVLKEGKAKKLLGNGRDAAASGDSSRKVFFAAKDGLYVYNPATNSAEKYGTITDSIVGIAKEKEGDVIYILTEGREVYKVSDNGEKKELLEDVVKAKKIVLDYESNLYFYSDDNVPYVRTGDGVKKIEGLPEVSGKVTLVKPPFFFEDGVPFVTGNQLYVIYSNGTSELTPIEFQSDTLPTAYAPEAGLIQYYAYDKKIYEYNILALLLGTVIEELGEFLNQKSTDINTIASKHESLKRKIKS